MQIETLIVCTSNMCSHGCLWKLWNRAFVDKVIIRCICNLFRCEFHSWNKQTGEQCGPLTLFTMHIHSMFRRDDGHQYRPHTKETRNKTNHIYSMHENNNSPTTPGVFVEIIKTKLPLNRTWRCNCVVRANYWIEIEFTQNNWTVCLTSWKWNVILLFWNVAFIWKSFIVFIKTKFIVITCALLANDISAIHSNTRIQTCIQHAINQKFECTIKVHFLRWMV